jgi:hypothetical protein
MWGGGDCRKFEGFLGNFGGFAPAALPEKVNEFPPLLQRQKSQMVQHSFSFSFFWVVVDEHSHWAGNNCYIDD